MEASPPPLVPPARTSGLAIASLVCGILALPTCGMAGVAGAITGHLGLSDIKKSAGAKQGGGLAVAGLVLSYTFGFIGVVAGLAGFLTPVLLKHRMNAARSQIASNVKALGFCLQEFDFEFGAFPSDQTAEFVARASGSALPMEGPDLLHQLDATQGELTGNLLAVPALARGDWHYRPGLTSDSGPATVLLVSPVVGGRVVTLQVGGAIHHPLESEIPGLLDPPEDFIAIPPPARE